MLIIQLDLGRLKGWCAGMSQLANEEFSTQCLLTWKFLKILRLFLMNIRGLMYIKPFKALFLREGSANLSSLFCDPSGLCLWPLF